LPDGRLVSGGQDAKIWPKDFSGEPEILPQGSPISSLAVLADGRLASGGEDGKIKLWIVDEQKLIAALCLRVGSNFTKGEWARYLGSDASWQPSCQSFGVPSNWQTLDENNGGEPTANNAPSEAWPAAMPASSPPAVPPTGGKESPAPTEPAQPLVARGAAPQSSPQRSLLDASAKESLARASVFGDPGDSGEHEAATPELRGEVESAAPTTLSAPGLPPAGKRTASAPPSASGDLDNSAEHQAATLEGLEDPQPRPAHHPQHITHSASRGNIRASTGTTTAHLNQQELARHRSVAETPDNGILGFFKSLFH